MEGPALEVAVLPEVVFLAVEAVVVLEGDVSPAAGPEVAAASAVDAVVLVDLASVAAEVRRDARRCSAIVRDAASRACAAL